MYNIYIIAICLYFMSCIIKFARWCAFIGSCSKFNVSFEHIKSILTRALHDAHNNIIDATNSDRRIWTISYSDARPCARFVCDCTHTQFNKTFTYIYIYNHGTSRAIRNRACRVVRNYSNKIVYKIMGAKDITRLSGIAWKLWFIYYS